MGAPVWGRRAIIAAGLTELNPVVLLPLLLRLRFFIVCKFAVFAPAIQPLNRKIDNDCRRYYNYRNT